MSSWFTGRPSLALGGCLTQAAAEATPFLPLSHTVRCYHSTGCSSADGGAAAQVLPRMPSIQLSALSALLLTWCRSPGAGTRRGPAFTIVDDAHVSSRERIRDHLLVGARMAMACLSTAHWHTEIMPMKVLTSPYRSNILRTSSGLRGVHPQKGTSQRAWAHAWARSLRDAHAVILRQKAQ